MHFHYCGNPLHDIVHNLLVLMLMMPDWLPGILSARVGLRHRLLGWKEKSVEEVLRKRTGG